MTMVTPTAAVQAPVPRVSKVEYYPPPLPGFSVLAPPPDFECPKSSPLDVPPVAVAMPGACGSAAAPSGPPSQYSNFRGHRHKSKCTQSERLTARDDEPSNVLCSESLAETVEKLRESDLKEIRHFLTPQTVKHIALYGPELLFSQLSSVHPRQYQTSPLSFFKDFIPHRGFKTKQSLERESVRQATVANRLKDGLKSKQRTISSRTLQQETENNPKLKSEFKVVEEAKQELQEIVEFLRNPEKFTSLGAELPKGVLLVGPPGTGKTLLARAVAGEAGVPFFHAAGPEFDEILVGQGARRVRDLFRAAKMRAPCVIFIDEIDSVGAKRSNSVLHPYANQTINQLLAEMDGFHKNEGVIVLGATNRRDDLDKALLRPGRFDVEVQVPIPDLAGREEIFEYYLGKVKIGDDVDRKVLSRGTTGFTGKEFCE
ncbi:uncharacterized protein LOC135209927 [Macrobrachium nipponense]|uniref:uncharacterized protein LOC135209927 n=1 Tax=Macrobrachium nipponense TaxID=159736 RepID=UPI0030C8729D